MRRFTGNKLIIATHNAGKLREFQELLGPYVREIVSAGELGLSEPVENGTTFTENALIKARAAAQASGQVALGDDSGLCVAALGGKPGLFSSRWGGPSKDWMMAMRRIHEELGAALDRSAFFVCVLALAWPDGHEDVIEGRCDGTIVWPPRGDQGHGYDPVFMPQGYNLTFAEMDSDQKNALSHRGKALRELAANFFEKS